MIENFTGQDTIEIKSKTPEQDPLEVLQSQHIEIHKVCNQIMAQNGVLTVLVAKICEELKINLNDLMNEMKKQTEASKK